MKPKIIQDGNYEYVCEGNGHTVVLLHGLFGALSNWETVLSAFSPNYRVLIPFLPIYKTSNVLPSIEGIADYVMEFIRYIGLSKLTFIGNSLGGHIGLIITLKQPHLVSSLILTGSSGLFESGMGSTFFRRGDYHFIKERVGYTFYDPKTATKELVDEVFETVNDSNKALRIVKIARAAQRMNLLTELPKIQPPTCLIWGLNDTITPVEVAYEFYAHIPNVELHFIDKCGHAAMMEQPNRFNIITEKFLKKHQF